MSSVKEVRSYCRDCGYVHGRIDLTWLPGAKIRCPVTADGVPRCRACGSTETEHPYRYCDRYEPYPDSVLPVKAKQIGTRQNPLPDYLQSLVDRLMAIPPRDQARDSAREWIDPEEAEKPFKPFYGKDFDG